MSKKHISDALGIPIDQIKDDHMKYYYTKYPYWCCDIQPAVMLEDIEPFQFLEPVKVLADYSSYHAALIKKAAIKKLGTANQMINKKQVTAETDEMILQYIKCRSKIKILTVFPKMDIPKMTGIDVYYEKEIELDKKSARNLLYQLYAHTDKICNYETLNKMVEELGWTKDEEMKTITVYVMEVDIKGGHQTRTFAEAIEIGELYFCQNSVDFLKRQILDKHMAFYMRSCRFKINTFKNWLMQNVHLLDQIRFLTFSSSILYSYGLRRCNDYDTYFHWLPNEYVTPNFLNKIDKYFFNDNTRFPFIDLNMKGQGKWVKGGAMEHWDKWFLEDVPQMIGAKTMEQIIYDPKYHFYFMGLKCMTLELDIKRRLGRSRPASLANVIATSKLLSMNINIPDVSRFYYKMQGVMEKIDTPEKEQTFLHSIKCRLKERYRIDLTHDDIRALFKFSNATEEPQNIGEPANNKCNNKKTPESESEPVTNPNDVCIPTKTRKIKVMKKLPAATKTIKIKKI